MSVLEDTQEAEADSTLRLVQIQQLEEALVMLEHYDLRIEELQDDLKRVRAARKKVLVWLERYRRKQA
jgi:hypothetical protein